MARGWLRHRRNDIFPNGAADGAPSNCQKRGDFHLLERRSRFKPVTYKQRALQPFAQPLCNPATLPARFNLSSPLGCPRDGLGCHRDGLGCRRDGEPRACCSARHLVSSSGPLRFDTLHVLDALISMGFAGISGRSSPSQRLLPPKHKVNGFCHVQDAAVFTAPNLLCIRSGRNLFNCFLLPFLQGHQVAPRKNHV